MHIEADEFARANVRAWARLFSAVPGSWTRREGGALALLSGVALPWFNGVWGEETDVDPEAVARLLDDVAAACTSYAMQLRPGWPPEIVRLARERGLVRVPRDEPVMVLDDDRFLDTATAVEGLSLRELDPNEGGLHARVAADGGVVRSETAYRALTIPQVLATPGLRCYVGEVSGEAVTTAIGLTTEDCVGIFGVATLPRHRRRGYGAAVTARAARDGLDAGARWAWLGASPMGYPVYGRLGFVTVERTAMWETVPS